MNPIIHDGFSSFSLSPAESEKEEKDHDRAPMQDQTNNPSETPMAPEAEVKSPTTRRSYPRGPTVSPRIREKLLANPTISNSELSALVGCTRENVSRVRLAMEKARLIPVVRNLGPGNKVPLDNPHQPLAEFIAQGTKYQAIHNLSAEEMAVRLKIGVKSYREGAAIIRLANTPELSMAERVEVNNAIEMMNRQQRTKEAHASVKHLTDRMWGSTGGEHNEKRANARTEKYRSSITIMCDTCHQGPLLLVPFLSDKDKRDLTEQIKEAIQSLKDTIVKIRKSGSKP